MHKLISNIIYEDKSIVTTMNIKFTRNNKLYQKNAYLIIAPYIYNNLNNENVLQYFTDVTYYSTPTATKTYKILSLLGFDILNKKLYYVV